MSVAYVTGFMTKDTDRRYIIDQNRQLNLTTMKWFPKNDLGNGLGLDWNLYSIFSLSVLLEPKNKDEIKMEIE